MKDLVKEKEKEMELSFSSFMFAGSGFWQMPQVFNHYVYTDSPAGEDLGKKIVYTGIYGAAVGALFAYHDVLFYSKPKTLGAMVGRVAHFLNPGIGVTTAYCTGAYMAARIRGKDDEWTHAIGAASAATAFGAWRGSVSVGVHMAVVLVFLATARKHYELLGTPIMGYPKTIMYGNFRSVNQDYSLRRDKFPKGWTRNPEEA